MASDPKTHTITLTVKQIGRLMNGLATAYSEEGEWHDEHARQTFDLLINALIEETER